ncbi:MAG: hypothetical protein D6806_05470 [Deltaproteobacteria bacterium]|nr:MAG: hypothetical protein D6806_05470 [Deltaproteobacteria bacterium]
MKRLLFCTMILAGLFMADNVQATGVAKAGRSPAAATFVSLDELGNMVEKTVVPAWHRDLRKEMQTWPGKAVKLMLGGSALQSFNELKNPSEKPLASPSLGT